MKDESSLINKGFVVLTFREGTRHSEAKTATTVAPKISTG